MRMLPWMLLPVLAAGCAAPRTVPRAPVVAPLETQAPRAKVGPRVRADADRTPAKAPPSMPSSAPVAPAGSGDGNIQNRVIVEIVEVEVPVERPATFGRESSLPPDYGYYQHDYGRRSYGRRSRFPIHTAVGVGLGAIIGHQRGRRGRGALIGGGIGLLLDLRRRF